MSQAPEGIQGPDELEAALAAVENLDGPLSEHADAFERVHEQLQLRLEGTR